MNKLINTIRTTKAVFIRANPIVANVSDCPNALVAVESGCKGTQKLRVES